MKTLLLFGIIFACPGNVDPVAAQSPTAAAQVAPKPLGPPPAASVPADYVIGPEDVLGIVFWRDQDMTGDVTVRPDGVITLPLIGDIQASGSKPKDLGDTITRAATKFLEDINVTVVVRQINSRKVFITGEVRTPGSYPLTAPRTIMQVIALAGGLTEYADERNISVVRNEQGRTTSLKFDYKEVSKGKKLEQNILLRPGDTVVVP